MFKLGNKFSAKNRRLNKKGWIENPKPEIKIRNLDSNKWRDHKEPPMQTKKLDENAWIEQDNFPPPATPDEDPIPIAEPFSDEDIPF